MLRFSIQTCSDMIKHGQRWNEYNTSRRRSLSRSTYLCFILPADWHERWHQTLSETDVCLVHRKHSSFPIILWFLQKVRSEQKGGIWPLAEIQAGRLSAETQWNDNKTKVSDVPVSPTWSPDEQLTEAACSQTLRCTLCVSEGIKGLSTQGQIRVASHLPDTGIFFDHD